MAQESGFERFKKRLQFQSTGEPLDGEPLEVVEIRDRFNFNKSIDHSLFLNKQEIKKAKQIDSKTVDLLTSIMKKPVKAN